VSEAARRLIQRLLDRAEDDIAFRKLLVDDPAKAFAHPDLKYFVRDVQLSGPELTLLFSMRRSGFENAGIDVSSMGDWLKDRGDHDS